MPGSRRNHRRHPEQQGGKDEPESDPEAEEERPCQYGVTDPARRKTLLDLSKQATKLGWLQKYESELPEEYTAYISFESEAQSAHNYESLLVPGLLQTESYAHALVTTILPFATEVEVRRLVETGYGATVDRQGRSAPVVGDRGRSRAPPRGGR